MTQKFNPELFQSFEVNFMLNRTTVFEVEYNRCGNNKFKDFSTSASKFNRPKSDWSRCGQAQDDLLPKIGKVRDFYNKWDQLHLHDLIEEQYIDLVKDINNLSQLYNTLVQFGDDNIRYSDIRKFSMNKISKQKLFETI